MNGAIYSDGTFKTQPTSKSDKIHRALLYFLALLTLALLIVVIYLGVENRNRRNDIQKLQDFLNGSGQSNWSTLSGSSPSSSSSQETAVYPDIYLSANATAQAGYTYGGSLYRGSGYWAQQPPLQTARADFVMLNLNETLYIFGGHDENGTYLSSGESWAVLTNSSNTTAEMPQPRSHYGAAAFDNQTVHIVGGYASEANETSNIPEGCSFVYNVNANSWTTGACLNESRGSHCSAIVNGKLFAVGGVGSSGAQLDSIEVYQPSTNAWSYFARLPSGRSGVGCAASNKNLIVAGGTYGNGTDLKEVLAFDSSEGSMTQLADLPASKFELSLVSLPGGDVLSVAGGQHVDGGEVGAHGTERYSVESNEWVEKAQISSQRFGFGAAFADEGVYALGGHTYCANSSSEDCDNRILTATEIFYDSSHADIFVHLQNPSAITSNSPSPNTSEVLLLSKDSGVSGYKNSGSLYRGSGYWAQGSSLPQPLSDLNVVGYNNLVYIIGGLELDGETVVDSLYEYDPITDEYRNLSSLPEPRMRGGADILGGLLYYVGGYSSADQSAAPVDTTLVYNISGDSWTVINATLSSPRSDLCMAAVNGSLYAAGGYSTNYTDTLNLAEVFDSDTQTWTSIASMPTPRGDVICSALEGQFVVAGGFYDPSGDFKPASFRTEVEAYSPATETWTALKSLPVARGDAAMTTIPSQFGDRLVVLGGESEIDNKRTGVATHQVQEYSSALDQWILKAPMITPRFRHDVAYAEGHIIIFGGASSSVCKDTGDGLSTCHLRPVASVDEFFDTDNPDVFVYVAA